MATLERDKETLEQRLEAILKSQSELTEDFNNLKENMERMSNEFDSDFTRFTINNEPEVGEFVDE